MAKYVAFLRAINVGGHVVKMDDLRRLFESLEFSNVETFIASGNVLFETPSKNATAIEKAVEDLLKEKLGYSVATFLRTDTEVKEIVGHKSFPPSQLNAATAFNVVFLSVTLGEKLTKKVMALRTDIDDFHVHGRELYWLCRRKQSESTFSNAVLEKTLGTPSTMRGMVTVQKIAAKY